MKPTNTFGINLRHQPYHRRWNGALGHHPFKNHGGGAFGKTRKDMQRAQEQRKKK